MTTRNVTMHVLMSKRQRAQLAIASSSIGMSSSEYMRAALAAALSVHSDNDARLRKTLEFVDLSADDLDVDDDERDAS
jgi:hypothetical protein